MAIDLTHPILRDQLAELYQQGDTVLFIWKNEEGWPLEFVSLNVKKILGYSVEEFSDPSLQYAELIHPQCRERVLQEVAKFTDSSHSSFTHKDYRLKSKAGKYIWVKDTTVMRRSSTGEVLYYIGHITDHSSHYELLQATKMATVGQLSAGIAHEIKNPLFVALLTIQKLEKQIKQTEDNATTDKYFVQVQNNLMRIDRIVKSLLHFSRNEANAPKKPIPISVFLDDILTLVADSAKIKNVALTVQPFEDIIITCDDIQVGQVLLNLIHNSIDALEELDEKWIKINIEPKGAMLSITVTDSGTVISQEVAANMFDSFYTTKKDGKGTGLGLSLSRQFIKNSGGSLHLLSQKGGHTCFEISLPLTK